ncbi:MAG: SUMF1/EgtB/PvdO family nonheme iron enzyme [Candidatus Omnitrophota bacterium]
MTINFFMIGGVIRGGNYRADRRASQAARKTFRWLWTIGFAALAANVRAQEWVEPEMIAIPAGEFLFGSSKEERSAFLAPPDEPEQQKAALPGYFIGKYEITNEEFACFINAGGYEKPEYWPEEGWNFRRQMNWTQPRSWTDRDYNGQHQERYPVCSISWFEAQAYCRWLSIKTGKPYRLPTGQEWEKAARGSDGRIFPWGNEWKEKACNWLGDFNKDYQPHSESDGFARTSPVGYYEEGVSPYGAYDMAGNVMEWCADALEQKAYDGSIYRMFRGGSFLSGNPRLLRCAWRGGTQPQIGYVYWGIMGFRAAMDAPKVQSSE